MTAFISGGELVIVFLVVLLLFGAKSIPDIAKSIGKGMREFRKVSNDIRSEIDQDGITDTFKDIGDNINQSTEEFSKSATDTSSSNKRGSSQHTSSDDDSNDASTADNAESSTKKQDSE